MIIFLVVVLAAPFGINPPAFIAQLVAFAFGLAASTFFPAILLGIFDRRMNMQGAVAGMIVGLVFTASYIIGTKYLGWPNFILGITAEGIGAIGMLLNFVVAYLVSRATPPPSRRDPAPGGRDPHPQRERGLGPGALSLREGPIPGSRDGVLN